MAENQGVIVDVHTERLTVKLTDEARNLRGQQLARANGDLVEKRNEKAAVMSRLGAEEKEIIARIAALSAEVILGFAPADVEVYGTVDFDNGLVRYRRRDTGEELKTRAIREEERQMEVPGTEAIRAGCGHITAKPADGTLPKFCKTCQPDEEPRPPLKIIDYVEETGEALPEKDSEGPLPDPEE